VKRTGLAVLVIVIAAAASAAWWRRAPADDALTAVVRKGSITLELTVTGVLRPAEALAYRSPLGTRETEIVFLAAEGTHVGEGDLLARLDTGELERDLEHTKQELRQVQVELQAAEIDWQTAQGAVESISSGEGALTLAETQARVQASQKKVDRLRAEVEADKPLLAKGYMTQEELNRAIDALEQAETDLSIDRQRATVLSDQTRPRDELRARLTAAQKAAQRENAKLRVQEVEAQARLLAEEIENCSLHARRPGLVVYEEFAGANPRRKVRVGDRITGTQAILTIPEVSRMLVDASTSEADVHRFQPGQRASIHLEAFPDAQLAGQVERVGTLASASGERAFDDKRFDLVLDVDPSDIELRPGMTARADVTLGTRDGVLLAPVSAVFEENGLTVCRVVGRFGLETRSVRLGESSGGFVIVQSGLVEGDRVSLVDAPGASAVAPASPRLPRAAPDARNPLSPK